jgi:hypothetical protein
MRPSDAFDLIALPPDYPSLDYRPLSLAATFLVFTVIFLILCEAGIVTLVVISREDPRRLHFRNTHYEWIIQYSPTIVGLITSLWFRIIANTYLRLLPYIAMASVPVPSNKKTSRFTFQTMCGINLISIADWTLPDLFKYRYWVALVVTSTSSLSGLFLTPVKAGFLEVTKDDVNGGWIISISLVFAAIAIFIYLLLIVSVVSIFAGLHSVTTGLKWEPASIASQLAMLHMFEFQQAFTGAEFIPGGQIRKNIRMWTYEFGILRLGYWRNVRTGKVIHGLRLVKGQKSKCFQTLSSFLLRMADLHPSFPTQPPHYNDMFLHVRAKVKSKKPLQATYTAEGMCPFYNSPRLKSKIKLIRVTQKHLGCSLTANFLPTRSFLTWGGYHYL